jgi:hypothetical protein
MLGMARFGLPLISGAGFSNLPASLCSFLQKQRDRPGAHEELRRAFTGVAFLRGHGRSR